MPTLIDTFTRSVTDGLGTSDSGHTWITHEDGPGVDVDGSKSIWNGVSGGTQQKIDLEAKNFLGIFKFRFSALASGNLNRIWIYTRNVSGGNLGMAFRIQDHSDGDMRLIILTPGGVQISPELEIAEDLTVDHWVKFEANRNNYNLKVWKTTDPEPGAWTLQAQKEPAANFGTFFFIRYQRLSTNIPILEIDDLYIHTTNFIDSSPAAITYGRGAT